jgi:hypothetical protein
LTEPDRDPSPGRLHLDGMYLLHTARGFTEERTFAVVDDLITGGHVSVANRARACRKSVGTVCPFYGRERGSGQKSRFGDNPGNILQNSW